MSEIIPGQRYAIRSTAVRRAVRRALEADGSLGWAYERFSTTADPAYPGTVLATGNRAPAGWTA